MEDEGSDADTMEDEDKLIDIDLRLRQTMMLLGVTTVHRSGYKHTEVPSTILNGYLAMVSKGGA